MDGMIRACKGCRGCRGRVIIDDIGVMCDLERRHWNFGYELQVEVGY